MSLQVVKWLYPGMRVKRWVFLLGVGILLISSGLGLLVGVEILASLEHALLRVVFRLTGSLPPYASVVVGAVLLGFGIFCVSVGVRQTTRTLLKELAPGEAENIADIMFARRHLRRGPHIVVVGGGTGLSTLLRGLKVYTSNITAIVTVADDGGSSGRLREDFGVLPPGDIRNTLVALADTEPLMEELFQYRFPEGNGLAGHSFGNLFITAMHQIAGDFEAAVHLSSKVLAIRGRVLPSTLQSVVLRAEFADGSTAVGESQIPLAGKRIRRVTLDPANPAPVEDALRAIAAADIILLGPGSLYTSVLPNLLVDSMTSAIRSSAAAKVYICNVMTQPGETDNYTAADHLQAIIDHTGPDIVHYCLLNNATVPDSSARRYRDKGAYPVIPDASRIRELGVTPVLRSLISETNLVRHDPARLAAAVMELANRHRVVRRFHKLRNRRTAL